MLNGVESISWMIEILFKSESTIWLNIKSFFHFFLLSYRNKQRFINICIIDIIIDSLILLLHQIINRRRIIIIMKK
jgi:hypothetical protein